MKQSHTVVLERNTEWKRRFETEPYEAGWASEAIFFVRLLSVEGSIVNALAQVQISPDGIHWCSEGTDLEIIPDVEMTHGRVLHFGNWLRLAGELPAGVAVKVIVYLVLKE